MNLSFLEIFCGDSYECCVFSNLKVGATGLEPAASRSQTARSKPTELRSDFKRRLNFWLRRHILTHFSEIVTNQTEFLH